MAIRAKPPVSTEINTDLKGVIIMSNLSAFHDIDVF